MAGIMILIIKNNFRLKRSFRDPQGFHYTVGMYGQTLNIKNLKQMPNVILMAQTSAMPREYSNHTLFKNLKSMLQLWKMSWFLPTLATSP
jgi:hypothetical protein